MIIGRRLRAGQFPRVSKKPGCSPLGRFFARLFLDPWSILRCSFSREAVVHLEEFSVYLDSLEKSINEAFWNLIKLGECDLTKRYLGAFFCDSEHLETFGNRVVGEVVSLFLRLHFHKEPLSWLGNRELHDCSPGSADSLFLL